MILVALKSINIEVICHFKIIITQIFFPGVKNISFFIERSLEILVKLSVKNKKCAKEIDLKSGKNLSQSQSKIAKKLHSRC
jgi:hypothetical protein